MVRSDIASPKIIFKAGRNRKPNRSVISRNEGNKSKKANKNPNNKKRKSVDDSGQAMSRNINSDHRSQKVSQNKNTINGATSGKKRKALQDSRTFS